MATRIVQVSTPLSVTIATDASGPQTITAYATEVMTTRDLATREWREAQGQAVEAGCGCPSCTRPFWEQRPRVLVDFGE
jgi:hypothetical protein